MLYELYYNLCICSFSHVSSTLLTSQDLFSDENSKANLISKSAQLSRVEIKGSSLMNSDSEHFVRDNEDRYYRNDKNNSLHDNSGFHEDFQEVSRYRDRNTERERERERERVRDNEVEGRGRDLGPLALIASLPLHPHTPRMNPGVNTPVMTPSFNPKGDVSTNNGNNPNSVSIGLTNSERTTQSQIKARRRIQLQNTNRQNNEDRPRKVLNYAIRGRGSEEENENETGTNLERKREESF